MLPVHARAAAGGTERLYRRRGVRNCGHHQRRRRRWLCVVVLPIPVPPLQAFDTAVSRETGLESLREHSMRPLSGVEQQSVRKGWACLMRSSSHT